MNENDIEMILAKMLKGFSLILLLFVKKRRKKLNKFADAHFVCVGLSVRKKMSKNANNLIFKFVVLQFFKVEDQTEI